MEGSISLPVVPPLSSRLLSPMAALPHVRRQAASCRCAISAPSAILSTASATAAVGRRQASARARSTAPSPPGLHGEQTTECV
ncbi:hypothetical protein DAI22_08g076700 [Oryza sativa Japonica Group]|nr:hypothetical protein DAI22_08g076700 [Oryza sativa Japonica Group]KAF2918708.1 hypothetical protein DAI22_08g076700 [Oryza sativa Japonica Group]KAF2918709.1 hypothetical protein DAI22_08g076700 [Oryza sativa Japonica Group]KAF2918710.1 hypothetical protein DAI22_08g076700 [Oryza sativa Japonica Group]KAF2918711.1 hypothetical protein DAI22_08g076700 [Oryza sativa Japonica Group]